MKLDWDKILHDQPMLRGIPDSLREAARIRPFATGETLHHQGDRPRDMMCVLAGEIRLVRRTPSGGEIVLQRSRSGFVAEASMESNAYHCDIVAATEGWLLNLPIRKFLAALDVDANFRQAWTRRLAIEVRKLRAQNERLCLNSAADRILHYIEAEGIDGSVTLTYSRKAWAGELGLTHEVLYRTLRRLREDGTLVIEGDRIALA